MNYQNPTKMKASELRIGNLVYLPSKAIYSVDFLYKNYEMLNVWEPIQLTKEWLLDFGFKKKNTLNPSNWYRLDEFSIELIGFSFQVNSLYYLRNVKYVHQLQNLYFSLTGEELIYKNTAQWMTNKYKSGKKCRKK